LLAGSVDTSLASLLYSCTTDAVFSEVHDQWASRERCVQLMHCLSVVAELLVSFICVHAACYLSLQARLVPSLHLMTLPVVLYRPLFSLYGAYPGLEQLRTH